MAADVAIDKNVCFKQFTIAADSYDRQRCYNLCCFSY